MEKEKADGILTSYFQKIYGFAYKKAFSADEADELASEMMLEVYKSLLSSEEIYNTEGYIWRICEHTYAKFVSSVRHREGVSIDEIGDIPYIERYGDTDEHAEEQKRLRREIAFLSEQRRDIIYRFYFKNESIKSISASLELDDGTVKWHLNKARKELKEGLKMKREKGALGINPIKAAEMGHSGRPGSVAAPGHFLGNKLSLNIVYSVYFSPKNAVEIAEELGVTPVFIEDKITELENNGYLVKTRGGKYTTYVLFTPGTYSKEAQDIMVEKRLEIAQLLVDEYVPEVRKAIADVKDVYIPGGNRELFEAMAILYGITCKCSLTSDTDNIKLDKYIIHDLYGGEYKAYVYPEAECLDPKYKRKYDTNYGVYGIMTRQTSKYPSIYSWSVGSNRDNRKRGWADNLTSDYEYLYEYIQGKLNDNSLLSERIKRLRDRKYLGKKGEIQIMICKGNYKDFFSRIPELSASIKEKISVRVLDLAMQSAKEYPPQMQDLIIANAKHFFGAEDGLSVLDIMYSQKLFRPLTEKEKIAANLIMFSDILPGEKD